MGHYRACRLIIPAKKLIPAYGFCAPTMPRRLSAERFYCRRYARGVLPGSRASGVGGLAVASTLAIAAAMPPLPTSRSILAGVRCSRSIANVDHRWRAMPERQMK
jgi:hypothetical protein